MTVLLHNLSVVYRVQYALAIREAVCKAYNGYCNLTSLLLAGYSVFSGVRRSSGVQGLRVTVQSDKPPNYVESRVEAFLYKMGVGVI